MTEPAKQVFQQEYCFPKYFFFCEWENTFDAQSKSNMNIIYW
jgi:hypothetical protein